MTSRRGRGASPMTSESTSRGATAHSLVRPHVGEPGRPAPGLAGEDALEGPQQDACDDEDAQQRDRAHGHGRDAAREDLELGDEPGQAGQPEGGEGGDGEEDRGPRRLRGEPTELGDLVGARPVEEEAGEEEEGSGHEPVAHHLRHGPGDGHPPRLRGAGRDDPGRPDGEDDVAHVVDRRVGDHPLEVALREGHEGSPEHRDDADDEDDPRPRAPGVRQQGHAEADEAVRPELEEHAGEDGRPDGGGVGVGRGQPGVEGDGGCLDGEPQEDRPEDDDPGGPPAGEGVLPGELDHVEGVGVRREVEPDEPREEGERAEEGVEEEGERRTSPVAVTPPRDDDVHPDDRQVEEDEEEDEVGRGEQAGADGLQGEEQRCARTGPVLVAERVDRTGEEDDRRHRDEREREAVEADVVAAAHPGDPRDLLLERERALRRGVVGPPQPSDEDHLDGGRRDPPPPRGAAPRPGTSRTSAAARGRKMVSESTVTSRRRAGGCRPR